MTSWSEALVAVLLLASGVVVCTAGLGVRHLPEFFMRMHAPALASTLAVWLVALASIVHFSASQGSLALHVWLIALVLSITAPVTTVVLARAGLFRERQDGAEHVPPSLGGPS